MRASSTFAHPTPSDQYEPNERRAAATWCADHCDEVVTDWSLAAFQIIKAGDGYGDPMAASRSLAMMHLAMHDAVNAARQRFARYALASAATTQADAAVAAATAAHDMLAAL